MLVLRSAHASSDGSRRTRSADLLTLAPEQIRFVPRGADQRVSRINSQVIVRPNNPPARSSGVGLTLTRSKRDSEVVAHARHTTAFECRAGRATGTLPGESRWARHSNLVRTSERATAVFPSEPSRAIEAQMASCGSTEAISFGEERWRSE